MESNRTIKLQDRLFLGALLLISAITWLPRLSGPIDVRWDAGVYYTLGTSLYEGKGYRLVSEPGDPRAVQYPPLWPAIVAAHQWIAGYASPATAGQFLRRSMAVFTLAYVALSYLVARRWLTPVWAFAAGLIVALHPWTLFMSDFCFAEIPFGFVCMAFLLVHWASERAATPGRRRALVATEVVLGVAAFALRTLGMALLAAWAMEALFRKRYKLAGLRAIACVLPFLAWQGYVYHVSHSADYAHPAYEYQRAPYLQYNVTYAQNMSLLDPFNPSKGPATTSGVIVRTLKNAKMVPSTLGEMVSALENFWERMFSKIFHFEKLRSKGYARKLMFLLGLPVIFGLGVLAWRREWLVVLLIGVTLVLICLTPWVDQFTRYLTPLIPLFACALLVGCVVILQWFHARGRAMRYVGNTGIVLLAMGLAMCCVFSLYRMYVTIAGKAWYVRTDGTVAQQRLFFCEQSWTDFSDALQWLRANANATDTIVTTASHWTYLNTGLKSVQPPREQEPIETQRLLDTVPAQYFILDAFQYSGADASRYMPPILRENLNLWKPVFETQKHAEGETVRIYQRMGRKTP